jgi:oligopeptidase B
MTTSAEGSPRATLDADAATPPVAARRPVVTRIHGATLVDDYAWLRERTDPEVVAYLEAENAYAQAVTAPTEPLQQRLYDEILGHIVQTDLGVPYRLGEYWYYSRTEEGKQYPLYARKRGDLQATEEITLDPNELAAGSSYLGLGAYEISDDGNLLAYSVDVTGYRQYTLHVKDLRTGAVLGDAIERVADVVWSGDNATLYFTSEDDVSKRHDRFWRHTLGAADSTLLYEEPDEKYDIGAQRSRDRAYVFVASYSKATTEWRALRADGSSDALEVIVPRSEGHRADVAHHGSNFYIVTNRAAADFRLVVTPDDAPGEAHWREVIPAREGVHLESLDVFENHAVVVERSGGFANLEILDFATHALRPVVLPETVHGVAPGINPEYRTTGYRFSYSSLVTPNSVYEIDLVTEQQTLLKETSVPGYDRALYTTELRFAPARDGTLVPLSLVYRNDTARDGSAPMLLYAYGSYGISIDPEFSAARLALLDRGVVYGIAHVRGGGELGEHWRTAGHLRSKITTFEDFIACAEHAIAQKLTSSDRLAIQGGSAGGLLVAAVANMRPELFAAVLCQVPFVDVLNTMLDASLPLTTSEYLEWGDPNVPEDFHYMRRYSPYDNVAAGAYPAMLVRVSRNDSQVPYWEGAKLVARLRTLKTDRNPLLLVVNFGAGHGGASGRYDRLRETAFNYAFVLTEILA